MRMVRWICVVTREDRIRNKFIKGSLGVTTIVKKKMRNKLKRIGLDDLVT